MTHVWRVSGAFWICKVLYYNSSRVTMLMVESLSQARGDLFWLAKLSELRGSSLD